MNILIPMEHFYLGGGEKFVVELSKNLANRKNAQGEPEHNVTLFVSNDTPTTLGRETLMQSIDPAINVFSSQKLPRVVRSPTWRADAATKNLFGNRSSYEYAIATRLAWFMYKNEFDVVHTNWFEPDNTVRNAMNILAAVSKVSFGKLGKKTPAKIVTDHGGYSGSYPLYAKGGETFFNQVKGAMHDTMRCTDRMIAITPGQKTFWENENSAIGTTMPVELVFNGVPFTTDNVVTREMLGFEPDDFVIGHAARGVPEKGLDTLIDAFTANNEPKAKLLILGCGEEMDRLQPLHKDNPNIKFMGEVVNVNDYYGAMDLFVLATRAVYESSPNGVAAALGKSGATDRGLPVVVTKIGATEEQLTNPANGKLGGRLLEWKQNGPDVMDLREALIDFQTKPDLYAETAQDALGASRKFDMDRCADEYVRAYQAAIETQQNRLALNYKR